MVKFLINRPIAVLMTTLAMLLLGLVTSRLLPTSLLPDIAIPEITVQLSYPNNSARELETNIVRPLRNQLLQISNLKDVASESRDGWAKIQLTFDYGTNTDLAFVETNEKIDAALQFLPRDLERPKVIKASASDIPVLNIAVSLAGDYSDEKFMELSEFTETVLKKRIEQLPDVALADLNGLANPEVVIIPDIKKLQSLGITQEDISNAIKQNNFELGNLIVQNGIYQYNFKFSNPVKSVKDIENIFLKLDGKLFQIKDLAKVSLRPKTERGMAYYNGKRAIILAVIKQSDAQVFHLKESLNALTYSFQNDYPDLQFNILQDQSQLLKTSIDNLKQSLVMGSLLAIIIMFFFLKDLQSPLLIAVSIPSSLIVSLLFMYLLGMSINIISLSGLVLGVGMMIDNSIIVIDNINQKLESGTDLLNACAKGTEEIITPLLSSVLTTVSVFFPLVFLSGITGALFYDQALAVAIGLFTSLLVSVLLIPVLFKWFKDKVAFQFKWYNSNRAYLNLEKVYETGYFFFFKRKSLLFLIVTLSFVLGIVLFLKMPYNLLPKIDQTETILTLDWNENINVQENQKRLNTVLKGMGFIETSLSQTGEQQYLLNKENFKSFSEAEVYIKTGSPKNLAQATELLKQKLDEFPGSVYEFRPPKNILEYIFGDKKSALTAKVFSKTNINLPPESDLPLIESKLGFPIQAQIPIEHTAYLEILHENILLYEVDYTQLVAELKSAFNQNLVDNLKSAQKFIPIKIYYDQDNLQSLLNNLYVKNKNSQLIPIKSLVKISNITKYKSILADRNGEFLSIDLSTKNDEAQIIDAVSANFKTNPLYSVRFSGNYFELKTLSKEIALVIFVSLFLLYFIMAAQFESLWQPLVILLEIPINLGGALLLLWLFEGSIDLMSAIGFVVMSGIVINDSILKIHTINSFLKEGNTVEKSVKKAGKLRFKPILMTSLTTILALGPFLLISGLGSDLQKPLALTVIGGMILGTFVSLYFVPLIFQSLYKISTKKI